MGKITHSDVKYIEYNTHLLYMYMINHEWNEVTHGSVSYFIFFIQLEYMCKTVCSIRVVV